MPEKMFSHNPPLELAFSTEDGPRGLVHNTFRERSENLARAGRCMYLVPNHKIEVLTTFFFFFL